MMIIMVMIILMILMMNMIILMRMMASKIVIMMMILKAMIKNELFVMMITVPGTARVCLRLKPFFLLIGYDNRHHTSS